MSKRFNILLFAVILLFAFMPFFQLEKANSSNVYISGLALIPGLNSINILNDASGAAAVYESAGNIKYILLILFPFFGLALSVICEFLKNKKAVLISMTISYVIAFLGLVFAIFSVNEVGSYDLSFGYFGTLFCYTLVFAVGIFSYLFASSAKEEGIWQIKPAETKFKKKSKK